MDKKRYNIVLAIIFSLMITIPLYFRGLYFEVDLIPALIGIYGIFIIWSIFKIRKKDYSIFKDPTDYLLLGIVFMYGVSIFYGVNKRMALFELFRHMAYFIVFIMAKELSAEDKYKKILLNVILLGGLWVSLIGIGTATGTWDYNGAMLGTRLSSTFQYPNTLAAYVGALYFLGLTMLINEENKIIKFVQGAILGTFVFSLLLTYSRAMWLIFPLVGILYFIFMPNNRKLESAIYILASALLSLPGAFLFSRSLSEPSNSMWKYYILASIGTGILILLLSLLEKTYRKVPVKLVMIAIGIIVVGASFGVVYAINSTTEIELANDSVDNKNQQLTRNISKTLPSSTYTLEVDYSVKNNKEAPYGGRIRVFNIDNDKNTEQLAIENLVETSKGTINIDFETPEDSIGTRLYLNNYYGETSAVFNQVRVIDNYNNEEIYNVPLKYKYIPESIISRVSSLAVGGTASDARIIFMKDGLGIVKDNPILGTGGGGWVTLYKGYQSYPYWTTQAHNYVLQLWIEIGTIGLLIFLALMILITIFGIRTYLKEENIENKLLISGLYFTIIAFLAHAFIDFDMSLPSFTIVFWSVMGVLSNSIDFDFHFKNKNLSKLKKFKPKYLQYGVLILSVVLIFNIIQIKRSVKYAEAGVEASEVGDVDLVIENFEIAANLDKYRQDYYHDLTNLYMTKYEQTEDASYPKKAYEASEKFMELAKYDALSYGSIASFYFSIGKIEEGLALLDRAVELQPMVTEQYISKGNGYLSIFRYYYTNEEYDKAREVLERALEMKEDLKETSKNTLQPLKTNIDLIYKIGEIQYYLENFDAPDIPFAMGYNLDFAYYFDIDANNDGEIDMLRTSKPEGSNIEYEYISKEDEKFLRLTNDGEVYGFIYPYGIRLDPDTEYLVQMKAKGTVNPETMNVYAWSTSSEERNQGSLIGIPISEEWMPYIFEFTTDSDLEPGKQYIRIQHNGNDPGYIDIKELTIFKKQKE